MPRVYSPLPPSSNGGRSLSVEAGSVAHVMSVLKSIMLRLAHNDLMRMNDDLNVLNKMLEVGDDDDGDDDDDRE